MEEKSELMDRISALPVHVIHHILSFLSIRDVKVTSVLSKNWYHIYLSVPFLEFDDCRFTKGFDDGHLITSEASEKFVNHVSETLGRFQENNLLITRLVIGITLIHPKLVQLLNDWIIIVLGRGVEEFGFFTRRSDDIVPYNVSHCVIFAKSIKMVKLSYCSLLQPFPVDVVIDSRNSQLQKLHLDRVYLDEHILRSIISNCPLIENLILMSCMGIKMVQISHLCKLKSLFISSGRSDEIMMVDIDAPSLQSLDLKFYADLSRPRKISRLECPCLVYLNLSSANVEAVWLQNLVSRLSSLRKLTLGYGNSLQKLKISSDSLHSLVIVYCKNLIRLEIDAANLFSFRLTDVTIPKAIISLHPISQWDVKLVLCRNRPLVVLDTEFFFQLQNFISHANQIAGLHMLLRDNEVMFGVEESKDRADQPAPGIEHLTLEGISQLSSPNILNGLFWTCHPRTMSFLLPYKNRNDALTFVRNILVHWDCVACCHARRWLNHLQNVTVVSVEGAEDQLLINENISSYSLQNDSSRKIIFKFKW